MKVLRICIFVVSCLLAQLHAQQILVNRPAPGTVQTRPKVPLFAGRASSSEQLGSREAARRQRATKFSVPVHSADSAESPAESVPCSGPNGTRFNLEPRVNASIQEAPSTDFLLNGAGMGSDLIVQLTVGAVEKGAAYSFGGYYVHNSISSDCSVQFEGGLPPFSAEGDTFTGGGGVVKADSSRGVLFAANGVIGNNLSGIGLYRVSAKDLLNPKVCPNGTHTKTQATSCWEQIPPALLDQLPTFDEGGVPFLAVDERSTGSGTGTGDVYVAYVSGDESSIQLVACTNSLRCGNAATVFTAGSGQQALQFSADVQVAPNGVITLSFSSLSDQDGTGTLLFVTCTPAGAPKSPVCASPTTVATIPSLNLLTLQAPLENASGFFLEQTIPRHASRPGPGKHFTTFLVYDDCHNPFPNAGALVCLAGEVNLTVSTDSGKTWSKPVSVDTKLAHHFFGNVAMDASTGTASIVYFSTEGDPNFHKVRVLLNQIVPSSITPGPPTLITTKLDAADAAAPCLCFINAVEVAAAARGTGVGGQSRLYVSFNSSAVNGKYEGRPLPDLNNHISLFKF